MKKYKIPPFCLLLIVTFHTTLIAQNEPATPPKEKNYKNIIRYNLSGALLFGIDKFVIIGYERVLSKNQSFSINVGAVAFPKLVSINTDSFSVNQDRDNKGMNFSIDYRFYLPHENKFDAPHGAYIGPYYSYNKFERTTDWDYTGPSTQDRNASATTKLSIHTVGAEFGYQFVLWKRLALDLLLIGPGLGFYDVKTTIEGPNIGEKDREQLRDGLQQALTQKFPGMNFVFADNEINADGILKITSVGFRYLIHVGFRF